MKIAIASGKGGTGKTLVATNLAWVASRQTDVILAIVPLRDKVLVFPELCHGCYGCLELCPEGAVEEGSKKIGNVLVSRGESLTLVEGKLEIGEPSAAALVGRTKRWAADAGGQRFYDSPPGTSCPVIEAVKDADHVVLVGEPTRFGLHDLDLMARTLRVMDKPFGVVVNKAMNGECAIEEYCERNGIEVFQRIPLSPEIARDCAHGRLVAQTIPEVRTLFETLLERLTVTSTRANA